MKYLAMFVMLVVAPWSARAQTPIRIGSKAFTEGIILGEVLRHAIEATGTSVEHKRSLGGTQILWKALLRGDIDAYVEYSGTIAEEIYGGRVARHHDSLERRLRADGVIMLPPLGFNNTYAIGMTETRAARLGITTISQLAAHPQLRLGLSNEFVDRKDGWPGLRDAYGLPHATPRGMDHDIAYRALVQGEIDVVDLYSTDAEIAYYHLRVLNDDRAYFPAYDAIVLYRASLDSTHPGAIAALAGLSGRIGADRMIAMNAAVKIEKRSEDRVAADFVAEAQSRRTTAEPTSDTPGMTESVAARTAEHLMLVGISLVGAILIGVPLGVVASRVRWLGQIVLAATSVVYTIPSLALLVVMIPVLGIGTAPVLAALFLYSLLPIVRNTYAGLAGISPPLIESAAALGLSMSSRLTRIELPLALPMTLAGVKTAAVMNVGTATIGALVGAGGYGQPILTGIRLDDMSLILQGAIPAALLALLVQGFFDVLERVVVSPGLRRAPSIT